LSQEAPAKSGERIIVDGDTQTNLLIVKAAISEVGIKVTIPLIGSVTGSIDDSNIDKKERDFCIFRVVGLLFASSSARKTSSKDRQNEKFNPTAGNFGDPG
jgi:hypothetical protein